MNKNILKINILIDQNISFRLKKHLQSFSDNILHINDLSFTNKPDKFIWEFARKNDMLIITHDSDFNDLAELYGHPPKILWLLNGNLSTADIAKEIQDSSSQIMDFVMDNQKSIYYL